MVDLNRDYYAELGVGREADAAAIRAAYLRRLKAHAPEADPEGFQRLAEAYRALSHPQRRREYDGMEAPTPEAGARFRLLIQMSWTNNRASLAGLVKLAGEYPGCRLFRFAAGKALFYAKQHAKALPLFEALCAQEPAHADYQAYLGICLLLGGQVGPALAALSRALELDPAQGEACQALAHFHAQNGADREAVAVLERALARFPGPRPARILLDLLVPLARLGEWGRLEEVSARIAGLVPESDSQGRAHLARQVRGLLASSKLSRSAMAGRMLAKLVDRLAPPPDPDRDLKLLLELLGSSGPKARRTRAGGRKTGRSRRP